jgi:hypothetical protein
MYRIKVIESQDSNEYYPQYKFLFFWFNFETHQGPISFKNIFDCKKFIEYQKKLKKKENIRYIQVDD